MLNGEVVFCQIPLDGAPAPDHAKKRTTRVVEVPSELITGRFVGGVGDNDGSVSLIKTIGFESFTHKSEVAPSDLPLKLYDRSLDELSSFVLRNGLARWPYRDRTLHLFKVTRLRVRDEINAKILRPLDGGIVTKVPTPHLVQGLLERPALQHDQEGRLHVLRAGEPGARAVPARGVGEASTGTSVGNSTGSATSVAHGFV